MVNVWSVWDERLHASGRPARVARELTDYEILNMLASNEPDRGNEKRLLKEEVHRRLEHRPARHHGGMRLRPPTDHEPPSAPSTAAPSSPLEPGAFGRMPTAGDHVDPL